MLDTFIDASNACRPSDGDVEEGEVAVDDLEGGAAGGGVDTGVHDELSHGEVVVPVFLAVVGIEAKILLDFLVGPLRLSIGLRVIGSGEARLDA